MTRRQSTRRTRGSSALAVTLALVIAAMTATGVTACAQKSAGGAASMEGQLVLSITISPSGIMVNEQIVSLAELDSRLDQAKKRAATVWLWRTDSQPGQILAAQTPTQRQRAREKRLAARVVALVRAHHLRITSPRMPVAGSASPVAPVHIDQ